MIGNEWDIVLEDEFNKDYFLKIKEFVDGEYATKTIYPPYDEIFNAFQLTDIKNVKVVILGQDPYHEEGQAHGLAFSTPEGRPIPRSLKNIFKEIESEYSYPIPDSGCLESWARQGVLLLNSVLTVQKDTPASHRGKGWETFTDRIIEEVNKKEEPVVFILWGNFARSKKDLITNPKHLVLESPHPSPFSANAGFFGCNHFIKTNEFLKQNGMEPIDWQIENI